MTRADRRGNESRGLTRSAVQERLGDQLLVWIDPRAIEHYVWKNVSVLGRADGRLRRAPTSWRRLGLALVRSLRGHTDDPSFVVPHERYRSPVPIEQVAKYRKVADLVAHRDDYVRSAWYGDLVGQLERDGKAQHKLVTMRTLDEVRTFFEGYLLPLVDSMARTGYDPTLAPDLANGMVGADGALHKANKADHRFYVARILGVERVPMRVIAVHERWAQDHDLHVDGTDLDRLVAAVRAVERAHRPRRTAGGGDAVTLPMPGNG